MATREFTPKNPRDAVPAVPVKVKSRFFPLVVPLSGCDSGSDICMYVFNDQERIDCPKKTILGAGDFMLT